MCDGAEANDYHGSEVAVIGMACRFPQADGIEEFWRNLCAGKEAITFFSDEELEAAGVAPEEINHPDYVKAAPILADVDAFDAAFFDYTPREAEVMDPQQRLFLECAWQALEHAGYGAGLRDGTIGVFAGGKMSTYVFNIYSNPDLVRSMDTIEIGLGNDIALLSMRVSYKLDLKGPSYFVQSACSTSLVAIHLACQSLLTDECRMALAGAVAIDVPHKRGYLYREGSLASPDGHLRAFDAGARGTIFGSGLGAVVLKRLEDAIADGDRIYAVIKGSATNNDGAGKANFTAPSVDGEARVILEALVNAEVRPETISYVEAHGTGTNLGDPIEIRALTKAFRAGTDREGYCALGSVKTNLGHLDAAAGMSGFIKTVLALDRKQLPRSLNFTEPNPKIDFAGSPFYVLTELRDWPAEGRLRRAGVSSFGFGGTNSHVIVEEAPPARPSGESRPQQLVVLSARSEAALEEATARLAEHLGAHPDLNLADVAYTFQVGRRAFRHRRALVAGRSDEAARLLAEGDPQRVLTGRAKSADRPVVFLFSGQGSQYPNMGRELYEGETTFRQEVDACAELLCPHLGRDLRPLLFPEDETSGAQELEQTAIAQPALFVVEYALARLWMEWGVRPQAMIGHSIGEYVAACLAEVLSLEEALGLVAARGRLMQEMPPGTMLAVSLPEEEVLARLGDELALAAVNTPQRCVVSGPPAAVDALAERLAAEDVRHRRLHTSHAFHSAMMDPILAPFLAAVKKVRLHPPRIPYLSNLSGEWIRDEAATDPQYWVDHLRSPVRFAAGVEELLGEEDRVLLEVGPGNALATLVREHPEGRGREVLSSLPHASDRRPALGFLLTTLGRLWLAGVEIDGHGLYRGQRRHRVALPTYPFERQRYWITPSDRAVTVGRAGKNPDLAEWFYVPSWQRTEHLPRAAGAAAEASWVVFADPLGVGTSLARRLEEGGHEVVRVEAGTSFAKAGEGLFTINPERQEDYVALFRELPSVEPGRRMIAHLWTLTAEPPAAESAAQFDRMQELGFHSLIHLAQALGGPGAKSFDPPSIPPYDKGGRRRPSQGQIVVISNHLHEVVGGELLAPAKATLLGPCMVIPQEFPHLICRSIDLDLIGADATQADDELWSRILAETAAPPEEAVVAYRGPYRWVRSYAHRRLPAPAEPGARLRRGGVYLITGGLGGIGLVLAEYLARTVGARLILVGRSPLPARSDWEEWLASHDDEDGTSRKLRQIRQLEADGAEVLPLSADVADRDQMKQVVARADERFGTIHGVIHAAGIAGGGLIQLKTRQEVAKVFQPKTSGLLVLNAVFENRDLDFLVLFSSISSVFGEFGQVDYCAANLFLDAWAQHRRAAGPFTVAINWDTWQEVGIAVTTEVPAEMRQLREAAIRLGIANREGQEAFARILAQSAAPQVIVCTRDLAAAMVEVREYTQARVLAATGRVAGGVKQPRPELETSYEAPADPTEEAVAELWQEVLGLERVGRRDNFFDLGGHSLIATQIMSRLRDAFGLELAVEELFKAPTVAGLAAHVEAVRWAALGREGLSGETAADRDEGEL